MFNPKGPLKKISLIILLFYLIYPRNIRKLFDVIFVEGPHHSVLSHKACAIKQGWQDFSCTPCLSFSHLQGWKVQKSFFLKP
jgi:hypothetical protein